jgi:alkanesulfonate monooxygenase SsuD/methylene tetrahydromethanopterin reductase-like flavin-dependent oxidoreductase (luciferase family)
VRFALMTEPQQGLSYDEQLAITRRAEAAGFEFFFRSDHYQSFPGPAGNPTTDAWAVLAWPATRSGSAWARSSRR